VTPARLRPLAEGDLVERTRYYRLEAGTDVAERFFDAAISALKAIERMPGTGSPRAGDLYDIAGLRVRRIERFSCGWFYFVRSDHLDVVRLLADAQDLSAIVETFEFGSSSDE
jgi:toxin ParE1/3/4